MGFGTEPSGRYTVPAAGTRVRDVVRDVVAEIAAEELPLVEGLTRLDDATVVRRLGRRRQRREPLGFGMGELASLATPVIWLAVNQAAQRFGETAADGAAKGAKAALRRILRRRAAPVVVPALTQAQLAEVHGQILASAAQRGLGETRALAIADAVVARLALTETVGPAAQEGV
ncbi:hypothetical protein ABT095_21340 [Kitasatospora sp. NPDC002227]|uniref:hypothetical protein n=1 Tax=Kitasatospora sp. NPDC002227 TaxID=3154773 RepID=UPI0033244027